MPTTFSGKQIVIAIYTAAYNEAMASAPKHDAESHANAVLAAHAIASAAVFKAMIDGVAV
jgi:hypothetical protein